VNLHKNTCQFPPSLTAENANNHQQERQFVEEIGNPENAREIGNDVKPNIWQRWNALANQRTSDIGKFVGHAHDVSRENVFERSVQQFLI
jgi:hypothetical protein